MEGLGIRITMPNGGELVVRQAGPTTAEPDYMSGSFTGEFDDLVAFAKDGSWTVELTEKNRKHDAERGASPAPELAIDADDAEMMSNVAAVEKLKVVLAEAAGWGGDPSGTPGFP